MNAEEARAAQNDRLGEGWDLWGPYLSERAWGTVREDYSATGDAWDYFPHDHACSRAYRWSEDGIGGISDFKQRLCFAFGFWNGRDPILKERLRSEEHTSELQSHSDLVCRLLLEKKKKKKKNIKQNYKKKKIYEQSINN